MLAALSWKFIVFFFPMELTRNPGGPRRERTRGGGKRLSPDAVVGGRQMKPVHTPVHRYNSTHNSRIGLTTLRYVGPAMHAAVVLASTGSWPDRRQASVGASGACGSCLLARRGQPSRPRSVRAFHTSARRACHVTPRWPGMSARWGRGCRLLRTWYVQASLLALRARSWPRAVVHPRGFWALSLSVSLPLSRGDHRPDLRSVSRFIARSYVHTYVLATRARALSFWPRARRPLGSVGLRSCTRVPVGLVRSHPAGWLA